jgi:hypothetical protein
MSKDKPKSKVLRLLLMAVSLGIILEGAVFAALGVFNVQIACCVVVGVLILIYAIFVK